MDKKYFLKYLNSTYLGPNALFKIDEWNHFDHDGPRTNNNLEGFHNKLRTCVEHPNIFAACDILKSEENIAEINYLKSLLPNAPRPIRRKYVTFKDDLLKMRKNMLNLGEISLDVYIKYLVESVYFDNKKTKTTVAQSGEISDKSDSENSDVPDSNDCDSSDSDNDDHNDEEAIRGK